MNVELKDYKNDKIVILEGRALEQKAPVKITIDGNINAISCFMAKRWNSLEANSLGTGLQEVDWTKAIVIVDDEQMKIKLLLDPENYYGTEITGTLDHTVDLLNLGINESRQFTREELVKIIRFNRRFFDPLKHDAILAAYMKLNLSGSTELTSASDTRGTRELAFKKVINSQNIPTEFVLTLPIFKGFGPESFRVEVCLEATDASVRFWFESIELAELIEKRKKEKGNT